VEEVVAVLNRRDRRDDLAFRSSATITLQSPILRIFRFAELDQRSQRLLHRYVRVDLGELVELDRVEP